MPEPTNPTEIIKTLKKAPKPVVIGVIIGGLGLGYIVMRNFSASSAPPDDAPDTAEPTVNGVEKLNPGVIPVWGGDFSPSDNDRLPRRDAPIQTDKLPKTPPTTPPKKVEPPTKKRTPTKPPTKPPTPPKTTQRYPGLPDNWRLNTAEIVSRANLDRTFDDLWNTQKRIKPGDGIWWGRQLTSIAVQGTVSPWRYAPEVINAANAAIINQTRVKWGLFPLTTEQMRELEIDSRNAWQGRPTVERARMLFEKYNYPYQIATNGSIRRGR